MRAWGMPAGIVLLVSLGAGCSGPRESLVPADAVPAVAEQKAARAPAGVQTASNAGTGVTADKTAAPSTADAFAALKLIRTAEVVVEVERYETAEQQVAAVAERVGGYVATSQSTRGPQGKQSGSLS